MKNTMFTFLLLVLFVGTGFAQKESTKTYPKLKFRSFVPVAPIEFQDNVETIGEDGGIYYNYVKKLSKKEMQEFLTNETVLVSVAEVDKEGNLVFTPSRISKKNVQYIVTMDYVKFTTSEIRDQGDIAGEACVGIGLRIVANISSRADDLNLGDLFAIGMAVSDKKAYGSLRVEAIGMHDPEITAAIPLPSEISAAAIQSVMQTMSTIKYKIYDDKTKLSPQIIGIRTTKDGTTVQELNEVLMRHHVQNRRNGQPKKKEGTD